MLGRARFLQSEGYSVLLVDLPAHGESLGERITFGAREAAGVTSALAFLRNELPDERVGVIGVSLGAAPQEKTGVAASFSSNLGAGVERIGIRRDGQRRMRTARSFQRLTLRRMVRPSRGGLRPMRRRASGSRSITV